MLTVFQLRNPRVIPLGDLREYIERLAASEHETPKVRTYTLRAAEHALVSLIREARSTLHIYVGGFMDFDRNLFSEAVSRELSLFLSSEERRVHLIAQTRCDTFYGLNGPPCPLYGHPSTSRRSDLGRVSRHPPVRFFLADSRSWWFNDFGDDPTDVRGCYRFRSEGVGKALETLFATITRDFK